MRNPIQANGKIAILALVTMAGLIYHSTAYADENDAKNLLKAMSDYVGAQKSISFDYDTSLEVVTVDQQRLALASSGSVNMSRPDKIRATRTGGFADVEMLFDGKTLRGQECDHLAFRSEEVDWQIWVAQGPEPYPCRYIVTSKKVGGGPQYTLDIRNWKASAEAGSGDFSFKAPEGAKEVKPDDLKDIDELPDIFRPKT
jgi:hypothetical protein